jgi:hypothetical protein
MINYVLLSFPSGNKHVSQAPPIAEAKCAITSYS